MAIISLKLRLAMLSRSGRRPMLVLVFQFLERRSSLRPTAMFFCWHFMLSKIESFAVDGVDGVSGTNNWFPMRTSCGPVYSVPATGHLVDDKRLILGNLSTFYVTQWCEVKLPGFVWPLGGVCTEGVHYKCRSRLVVGGVGALRVSECQPFITTVPAWGRLLANPVQTTTTAEQLGSA